MSTPIPFVAVAAAMACPVLLFLHGSAHPEPVNDVEAAKKAFLAFKNAILEERLEDAWDALAEPMKQMAAGKDPWVRRMRAPATKAAVEHAAVQEGRATPDGVTLVVQAHQPNDLLVRMAKEDGVWKIWGLDMARDQAYPEGKERDFAAAAKEFARTLSRLFGAYQQLADAERIGVWTPEAMDHAAVTRVRDDFESAYELVLRYRDAFREAVDAGELDAAGGVLAAASTAHTATVKLDAAAADLLRHVKQSPAVIPAAAPMEGLTPVPHPVARGGLGAQLDFGFIGRFFDPWLWEMVPALGFDFAGFGVGWGTAKAVELPNGEHDFSEVDAIIELNARFGLKTAIGQANLGHLPFNHWDPEVVARHLRYFKHLGERYRDNPNVICYEIFNEPDVYRYWDDDAATEHVLRAFRAYLERKFGPLDAVNEALGTDFTAPEHIGVPSQPAKDDFTPLTYEWARFMQVSLTDFLWTCTRQLQEADPNHAALTQIAEWHGGLDAFLVGSGPPDVFSVHMTFGGRHGGENNMVQAYSLAKVLGKPLWQEEFIYNYPEASDRAGGPNKPPREIAAAIQRNVWQAAAWGFSGIEFFELDNFWQGWNNFILDREARYGLLSVPSGIIPALLERIRKVEPVLRGTRIVTPEIAILDCPTARLLRDRRQPTGIAAFHLERFLSEHHWPYLLLPEGGLDRPSAEMDKYRVILLPATTHIWDDAARHLMAWAQQGGKLVLAGASAIKDHYGRESALMKLPADRLHVVEECKPPLDFLEPLLRSVGVEKPVWFEGEGEVELMLREDAGGARSLIAINLNADREARGAVTLTTPCRRVTDLCTEVTMKLRRARKPRRVPIRLAPGEGTLWLLHTDP